MLSSLFTDLVDESCVKVNPCTGIKSWKHIVEKKEIFTDKELQKITERVLKDVPYFYNFFNIFICPDFNIYFYNTVKIR